MTESPRVILVGGAPRSGKSTASRALSTALGYPVISTDDLGEAARAVTDRESHADLHAFHAADYREYTVSHSVADQLDHAQRAHRALWPAVRSVIQAHAHWAHPAIIEGWALLPDLVAQADFVDVCSLWLELPKQQLESRVKADIPFHRGASDPDLMIQRFVERSVEFASWLREQTSRLQLPYLVLTGSESPEELAEVCLRALGLSLGRQPSKRCGRYS